MKNLIKKIKSKEDFDKFSKILSERMKDGKPISDKPMIDCMVIGFILTTKFAIDLFLRKDMGRVLDGTIQKLNKMIKIDFLDVLYTWKVEAEQKLEKLLEEKEQVTKSTEHLDKLRNLEIKHAEGIVNRYKTTISSYMAHHNCH
jgi:hypothetical protein